MNSNTFMTSQLIEYVFYYIFISLPSLMTFIYPTLFILFFLIVVSIFSAIFHFFQSIDPVIEKFFVEIIFHFDSMYF
jgi:hypothetical protein